jgi:hypothetical protein
MRELVAAGLEYARHHGTRSGKPIGRGTSGGMLRQRM